MQATSHKNYPINLVHTCTKCCGVGILECMGCEGFGFTIDSDGMECPCFQCDGRGWDACGCGQTHNASGYTRVANNTIVLHPE
jgi:hypothetical protein